MNNHNHILGWNSYWDSVLINKTNKNIGRITGKYQGLVILDNGQQKYQFHCAKNNYEYAVGDWCIYEMQEGSQDKVCRLDLLPRQSQLCRKKSGKQLNEQVLLTNIDTVFIVSSLNDEFNLNRLERYLALVWSSGAQPVFVLTKLDICTNVESFLDDIEAIALGVPVFCISSESKKGIDLLDPFLQPGHTVAMLGSSGVGKSTLLNTLVDEDRTSTQSIREQDAKGRHTTTNRELYCLPQGGVLIDTPGMRELSLWVDNEGLGKTFIEIEQIASLCKFRDCRHESEPGCAVKAGIEHDEIDERRLLNYQKLESEQDFLLSKIDPNIAMERKKKDKSFAKMVKNMKKNKNK